MRKPLPRVELDQPDGPGGPVILLKGEVGDSGRQSAIIQADGSIEWGRLRPNGELLGKTMEWLPGEEMPADLALLLVGALHTDQNSGGG